MNEFWITDSLRTPPFNDGVVENFNNEDRLDCLGLFETSWFQYARAYQKRLLYGWPTNK